MEIEKNLNDIYNDLEDIVGTPADRSAEMELNKMSRYVFDLLQKASRNEELEPIEKPFSIERAVRYPSYVETLGGRKVVSLVKFDAKNDPYPIVGICDEVINQWDKDGICFNGEYRDNLVIRVPATKVKRYVKIVRSKHGKLVADHHLLTSLALVPRSDLGKYYEVYVRCAQTDI